MDTTGTGIAIIGFPLGVSLPMGGSESSMIPSTSTTFGYLSKTVPGKVMQLDAFAAQGSSGSPVFDQRGYVVGVINSGSTESGPSSLGGI